MIDLRQLRYFIAVAEHNHVGRAAEALNMTQSPLSRQIMELENRLGIQLFQRTKKRLILTRLGQDFQAEAYKLLAHAAKLERNVCAMQMAQAGSLIIGYVDGAIHSKLLGKAVYDLKSLAPNVKLELRPLRSGDQFDQIECGEIDIGLSYSRPSEKYNFNSKLVHSEPFRLAVPLSRDWDEISTVEQLKSTPFIWYLQSKPQHNTSDLYEFCREAGFEPDIAYRAASPLAALNMVEAGLGIAIVQDSLTALNLKGVKFVDLPPEINANVSIFANCRSSMSPLENSFFELLR